MTSPTPSPVTLISADRLIDGTGRELLARGAVAVQGDRIVAVGPAAEVRAPDGAPAGAWPSPCSCCPP